MISKGKFPKEIIHTEGRAADIALAKYLGEWTDKKAYQFGWKDPRKMTKEELLYDYIINAKP